ncbi:fimbria/pilus periplasmic chaperone [Dyella psychrodurans]|uniref:Molecular chaperone n=1 Tax=Dyella psychrodurans TaxID=1927960 RepID=A0A370X790_9GAMM|nr:fimbria/pilus periplasmic chaperone [Dyella psychrodurans]RDS84182.1 molecular chaperone [Dyella psychrodurans]
MNNVMRYAMAGLFLCAGIFAGRSEATVVIGGTRVVYPAQEKEVTIKLTNQGTKPALVQVWLDTGDEHSTPTSSKVPFEVMPPFFRLDPSKGQAVRVMYSGEPLPTDKETLFWVNVLEVPPKSADDGRNLLQFAFRTRIKLFFRPAGLPGTVNGAPEKLTWKLVNGEGGKGMALQVANPTPYYVNFASVGVKVGERSIPQQEKGDKGGMVAPGGTTTFQLEGLSSRPTGDVKAQFGVITDFGAINKLEQPLTP